MATYASFPVCHPACSNRIGTGNCRLINLDSGALPSTLPSTARGSNQQRPGPFVSDPLRVGSAFYTSRLESADPYQLDGAVKETRKKSDL